MPGDEENGPNSAGAVGKRIEQLYKKPYKDEEKFVPREIRDAICGVGRAALASLFGSR